MLASRLSLVGCAALLKLFASAEPALGDCSYTCWDYNPAITRYAACNGPDVAPAAAIGGSFVQEGGDCGSCGYAASRIKGYWPSTGANNWAWVYPAALSNPTPCSPEIMDAVAVEKQRLQELKPAASASLRNATINSIGDTCVAECRAAGKYAVSQPGGAMVRGGTTDTGCTDHHFLGWLLTGETFQLGGMCDSTCCWCQGYAYGNVNNVASVECSEVTLI